MKGGGEGTYRTDACVPFGFSFAESIPSKRSFFGASTSFFFRMKMKQWDLGLDLNSTVCRDRCTTVAFGESACE